MIEIPRPALVGEMCAALESGATRLLTGPPGSGKSWLLRAAASELRRRGGREPLQLDLLLAVASPERFARSVGDTLRRARPGAGDPADADAALMALAATPGPLLLDEVTEIRALSTFAGLREVADRFGALFASRPATLLATSLPRAAASLAGFEAHPIPPLTRDELAPEAGDAADAILAGSGGMPGAAAALLQRVRDGQGVFGAWVDAMRPGAELERACRGTWETLLLRSRGYAMSKALLEAVALEEGLNLTALVERVGRTPGAVRDYLGWLLDVDALRSEGKRYFFVDPLLRDWLRLYASGHLPGEEALLAAARERLGSEAPALAPRRHDALMEID
jgi:hypothetical protein